MKNSESRSLSSRILYRSASLVLLFIIFFSTAALPAGDYRIIAFNSRRGVIISEDSGGGWRECNKNLPSGIIPEKIVIDSVKNIYLATSRSGIFKLDAGIGRWQDLNSNDLVSPLHKEENAGYRRISAFAVKENEPDKIALATKHSIYVSGTQLKSRQKIYENGSGFYITALAYGNGGELYAGTSCDGLFRINNGQLTRCAKGLPGEQHSKGLFFYEEISNITADGKTIYAAMNFGGGVFVSKNSGATWEDIKYPAGRESFNDIFDMKLYKNFLYISGGSGINRCDLKGRSWSEVDYRALIDRVSSDPDTLSFLIADNKGENPPLFYKIREAKIAKKKDFAGAASGRKAFYTSAFSIGKKLDEYIALIKASGFNAVVIDMKDDYGDICFSTGNQTAKEIGAVKNYVNTSRVLGAFRKNVIYVIARIVVFKDEKLYRAYDNKYAIWDAVNKCPWRGNPREFWVDPYSDFVRRYNIEIAAELEKLGFDEIQFDYIRFPSDGPVGRCSFRHREAASMYKSEALCLFLREAKERLDVPVSTDVYGYNAWYRVGSQIGQDVQEFAGIADVICPMNYSSHFGRLFYNSGSDIDRTSRIIYDGGRRARKIVNGNVLIRPYLQAFNLLSPSWGPGYINCQINGAVTSGCSGYTFWNARGDYKMVARAASACSKEN